MDLIHDQQPAGAAKNFLNAGIQGAIGLTVADLQFAGNGSQQAGGIGFDFVAGHHDAARLFLLDGAQGHGLADAATVRSVDQADFAGADDHVGDYENLARHVGFYEGLRRLRRLVAFDLLIQPGVQVDDDLTPIPLIVFGQHFADHTGGVADIAADVLAADPPLFGVQLHMVDH